MPTQVICLFLNWAVCFLLLSCSGFSYILNINTLIRYMTCKYIFPILWVAFSLCWYSPLRYKSLYFWWNPIYFVFCCLCFLVSFLWNYWQIQCHEAFLLCLLLSLLKFWVLWVFDSFFFFVNFYSIRYNFILLQIGIHFSQYHLLKTLSFLHWMVLAPLSKIIWPFKQEFISGFILSHWLRW